MASAIRASGPGVLNIGAAGRFMLSIAVWARPPILPTPHGLAESLGLRQKTALERLDRPLVLAFALTQPDADVLDGSDGGAG